MNKSLSQTLTVRLFLGCLFSLTATNAWAISCATGDVVDYAFAGGARWEMCLDIDDHAGPVFSKVHYTTSTGIRRQVLKQANLAHLNVMLDDGTQSFSHVTDEGLGGAALQSITSTQCAAGRLHQWQGRDIACAAVESTGYTWKYYSYQRQGQALNVSSLIKLPTGDFVMRWTFADDGTITPAIGHFGDMKFTGTDQRRGWYVGTNGANPVTGLSMTFEYIWRLDFDIGSHPGDDIVEVIEVAPDADRSKKFLFVTPVAQETSWRVAPMQKRSWRVRDASIMNADGHPVSYHLEPVQTGMIYRGNASTPWAASDLYVSTVKSCERYGSRNPQPCASDVSGFIDNESLAGQDVVLWYRTSFHRLPRQEDRDGFDIGWSLFNLKPRDWTATHPLY